MIACFKKNILFLFMGLISVFLFDESCQAQDSTQSIFTKRLERAEIIYVNQCPTIESKHRGKSLRQIINNIIFGKEKQEFKKPVSMVVGYQNSYWILDQKNNAVFQVQRDKSTIPHFIEKKNYGFSSLVGICNFRKSEILFTDSYLNKIFLVNPEKKSCVIFNSSLKMDKPTGIAYSQVKNEIWVVETGAHRVIVLNEKGEQVKVIGKRGKAKGEFNFPTHIWIDKTGNVYVVDAMNFRVQVFNKEGELLSVFGSNGDATGYFASPKGIATDSYGHIYIADALFHVVQIFDINGKYLYTFGSQGQGEGQFWMPSGIYIDDNDKIYVSDCYNSRIQIFQLVNGGKK